MAPAAGAWVEKLDDVGQKRRHEQRAHSHNVADLHDALVTLGADLDSYLRVVLIVEGGAARHDNAPRLTDDARADGDLNCTSSELRSRQNAQKVTYACW
jgi:hypothetical protein